MSYYIRIIIGEDRPSCLCRLKLPKTKRPALRCGHDTLQEAEAVAAELWRRGIHGVAIGPDESCPGTPPRDRKRRLPPQKPGPLRLTRNTTVQAHGDLPEFTANPPTAAAAAGAVTCHACGSKGRVRLVETIRRSYPITGASASDIGEPTLHSNVAGVDYSEPSDVFMLECECGASAPYDAPGRALDFSHPDDGINYLDDLESSCDTGT